MATLTVSLPDPLKAWIEQQISQGQYADAGDYLRDLVRRDQEMQTGKTRSVGTTEQPLSLEEARRLVAEAKIGGVSQRSPAEIFAAASSDSRSA
ncbi:type II toxin-antitoxin system ParD family antitoxin [Ferrovibrio sp.]|uniref:ribbon-helix-helix domain-containing protein n=1 Tax=Ferrovibrio sp. TaxID=1917215 RepID=UPI001B7183F5|nr:type II toxin-antitoxin system ParD family antitoxin [Ferrovibrio sp.]MBP7064904.1 type II toxin-antitoxin system ParD family antitoxin [Ferrovibrio sp.]